MGSTARFLWVYLCPAPRSRSAASRAHRTGQSRAEGFLYLSTESWLPRLLLLCCHLCSSSPGAAGPTAHGRQGKASLPELGSRGAREHPRPAAPAAPVVSSVFLPAHGGVFGHIRHLVPPDSQSFLFPEASFVPGGEGQGIAGFRKKINVLFPIIP